MAMMGINGHLRRIRCEAPQPRYRLSDAAIELLSTYSERLGLKGKVATHWARNPHHLTAA